MSTRDRDVNPGISGTGRVRAGIGIYYFQEKYREGKRKDEPSGDRSVLVGSSLLAAVAFALSTCGGIGGSEFAGGGTGGTGISTGSITGFGSVVMNGVHFRTDGNVAPGSRRKNCSTDGQIPSRTETSSGSGWS